MRNKIFFALILFLLLIVRTSLAQNVSGRVFENGSTYGVANVQVSIYANSNLIPTITQTNSTGSFAVTLTEIIETPHRQTLTLEASVGPNPGSTQTLMLNKPTNGHTEITVYDLSTGEQIKKLFSGELD